MFQLKTIHIIDFRFHSNTVTMLQYHCDTVHLHLTICTVFTPKLKTCVSVCVCVWGGMVVIQSSLIQCTNGIFIERIFENFPPDFPYFFLREPVIDSTHERDVIYYIK